MSNVNPNAFVLLLGSIDLAVLRHETAALIALVLALVLHVASVYEASSR